jgi:hypothetical protein
VLIGLGWRGSETEIIFSTCLTAHANHRIPRNPSTDGTMRVGLRAVVTVRRESARATPTFGKKLQLRRVQRSRLNGRDARLSDLEAELERLAIDARRSPQRIFRAHLPDQCAQIRGDLRSAFKGAGFPTPGTGRDRPDANGRKSPAG